MPGGKPRAEATARMGGDVMTRPRSSLGESVESRARAPGPEARGLPSGGRGRVIVDAIEPALDGGAYAAKRVLRERITVSADLISDGHDIVAGELLLRRPAPRAEQRPAGAEPFDRSIGLEPLGN